MANILSDVRVIDLSRILAGPYATMILGDLGADVVKVERPGTGDDSRRWGPPFVGDTATYYLSVNRNKRGMTLDLKAEAGRGVLWRLLEGADVVASNFRAGLMDELGFGFERLAARLPRLICAQVSGYGPDPARATRAAFDLVIQAETGLMDLTGEADGDPVRSGISIADEIAGLYLVQGILAALLRRERDGVGGLVEVPLNDALLSAFTYQTQQVLSTGGEPRRMGAQHPSLAPYQPYSAADGAIVIGVANERQWHQFCAVLDAPQLVTDPRFADNADRVANRDRLQREIETRLAAATTDVWVERLRAARVPCGRIRPLAAALREEIDLESGLVATAPDGSRTVASPLLFDGQRGAVRRPPPALGEHSEEVLGEVGYSAEEIAGLRAAGVI